MTVVITGCGRSGTTYIARLLTHAGLRCRHEHVFGLGASKFEFEGAAEASWLAVPRLGELRTRQIPVVHQVRDPIAVLRSFLGIRFFAQPIADRPHAAFVRRHDPLVYSFTDPLRRAMTYWVRWNLAAEFHARMRYRVEDVDLPTVQEIARFADTVLPDDAVRRALREVDRETNHRTRDESVSWANLPDEPITEAFEAMARRYGYR